MHSDNQLESCSDEKKRLNEEVGKGRNPNGAANEPKINLHDSDPIIKYIQTKHHYQHVV